MQNNNKHKTATYTWKNNHKELQSKHNNYKETQKD